MSVSTEAVQVTSMSWQARVRILCTVVAAIVVADAMSVGAPFLAFLAVPFLVAALGLRKGHLVTLVGVCLWSAFYVVLAVNYAVAHRFDAPVGDLVFAYVGGPVAAAIAVISASRLPRSRR
jgi:hypothetical protein